MDYADANDPILSDIAETSDAIHLSGGDWLPKREAAKSFPVSNENRNGPWHGQVAAGKFSDGFSNPLHAI